MAKKKNAVVAPEPEERAAPDAMFFNPKMLASVALRIHSEGSVSRDDLKTELGPEDFAKCIAILYRNYGMIIEKTIPWRDGKEAVVYQWANKKYTDRQLAKMPPGLELVARLRSVSAPRYTDWRYIGVRCQWITSPVGAFPQGSEEINSFPRTLAGDPFIPAYGVRAMSRDALTLIGKENAWTLADRIGFAAVIVSNAIIKIVKRPIVADVRGRETGLGMKLSEAIEVGTEFVIEAMIPTSELPESEFIRMCQVAGRFVRLSPARSKGFGEFVVLGAKE